MNNDPKPRYVIMSLNEMARGVVKDTMRLMTTNMNPEERRAFYENSRIDSADFSESDILSRKAPAGYRLASRMVNLGGVSYLFEEERSDRTRGEGVV